MLALELQVFNFTHNADEQLLRLMKHLEVCVYVNIFVRLCLLFLTVTHMSCVM